MSSQHIKIRRQHIPNQTHGHNMKYNISCVNSIPDPVGSDSEWEQAHSSVTKNRDNGYSINWVDVFFHMHTLRLFHSAKVGHCRYDQLDPSFFFPFCQRCRTKEEKLQWLQEQKPVGMALTETTLYTGHSILNF